jgi:putative FmdB family regulatory protein
MPTYEYACSNCREQWEEVQRITEPATTECPKCHKLTAQRQISAGNFILKGGGWYADAYSSAKPAPTKTEGKAESAEAKTETKGEAKTEKKADAKESTPAPAATPAATTTPTKT